MTIESKQTQKGFTLIELMIVVAIIGILASIAIPQFSAFRAKAFNSSAVSDLHAVSLAQEGLYTDYQVYGSTQAVGTATPASGAGVPVTVPAAGAAKNVIVTTVLGQDMGLTNSKNVTVLSNTNATFDAATTIAKHKEGDKVYGAETDQASIFFQPNFKGNLVVAGQAVTAAAATATNISGVTATANTLDLTGNGWASL